MEDNEDAEKPELPEGLGPPELPQNEHNLIGDWSSGLCACCRNPCNAILTCCCPCWTFGRIANIIDNGGTSCCVSAMTYVGFCCLFGLTCKLTSQYRAKLRLRYGIRPSPAIDSVTHLCCDRCALCQEYRELEARGWDPSIGWERNQAMKNMQRPSVVPPVNQTMKP